MEEPGNLELATKGLLAKPADGNRFAATVLEFEYGVKGWWTSELYLDGQTTSRGEQCLYRFPFRKSVPASIS